MGQGARGGLGRGGGDPHTDVLLWVPLLLSQEASEKKTFLTLDTVNAPTFQRNLISAR